MKKEIGIPKSAPPAVKAKDAALDKKTGTKEGSAKDLKQDKAMMKGIKKY
jgi:hypothetical protein